MKPYSKTKKLLSVLQKQYPNAKCELNYKNPFELLMATILSAQCTDTMVNSTTSQLFNYYPDAFHLAAARRKNVEVLIYKTGFFKTKAKHIIATAQRLVEMYHGQVPDTLEDLLSLPGVGKKTANVILGNAYHINLGIVVDTHVKRIAQRLNLSKHSNPLKIEHDLMLLFPRKIWTQLSHLLIAHGRKICKARKPFCEICPLSSSCAFSKNKICLK